MDFRLRSHPHHLSRHLSPPARAGVASARMPRSISQTDAGRPGESWESHRAYMGYSWERLQSPPSHRQIDRGHYWRLKQHQLSASTAGTYEEICRVSAVTADGYAINLGYTPGTRRGISRASPGCLKAHRPNHTLIHREKGRAVLPNHNILLNGSLAQFAPRFVPPKTAEKPGTSAKRLIIQSLRVSERH